MDEIEYKLDTNNSVLVVNAIDKLISTIKSKFKPTERQRFVLENEELKFLREKCSSKGRLVSLTACQGLLALVELGVLEIGHTMSTVITLLPSAHNYSAIISTMAGLLTLDLRSRLVPGQPYVCQFGLRTLQHPLVTVLEQNKGAEDEVLAQMHALCTHPDYIISSNSIELLRPVFIWLACDSRHSAGARPWQLLLELPRTRAQEDLLLACLSCQQMSDVSCWGAVADAAVYQGRSELVAALLPVLARLSTELLKNGRDPRSVYSLLNRCAGVEAGESRAAAGLTVSLLAENLVHSSALYLHELFNLCLNIISKYEYSSMSLNTFVALSLQWLQMPSYLTSSALKIAAKIVDTHEQETCDNRLYTPNLRSNKTFQKFLYTDGHLEIMFKLHQMWERVRDNPDKLRSWFDDLDSVHDSLKLEMLPFFLGVILERRKESWFESIKVRAIELVSSLVNAKKEVSVQVLPVLVYEVARERSPAVKMACLRALPLMAKTKENVPTIVAILNKLRANKGVPTSFLIMLYTSLTETQVRCFPYLQELLAEPGAGRADDLRWEVDVARAMAVHRICETRSTPQGLELVSVISALLSKGGVAGGGGPAGVVFALRALRALWRCRAVAPLGAWRALQPRLAKDERTAVQVGICELLSEIPSLRVSTPEYDELISDTARRLWSYIADSSHPEVVFAACDALARYRIDDYKLKDVPEVYRRTVKLPASYCKTPVDAARKPEDVLDYIPCNITIATSPSYDFPEPVLLSICEVLSSELPRPLPPLDLSWLHASFHVSAQWRRACIALAARQAQASVTARRFLENYLMTVVPNTTEESDILLVFELLPVLCRSMPPNTLRDPIQKCLSDSYAAIASVKNKNPNDLSYIEKDIKSSANETDGIIKSINGEYLFIRQLELMRECLECEKIHDANRTLLSQIVENYFTALSDDNVAWPTYVRTSCCLSSLHLERMTSPSGWWEVTSELLRKATTLRAAVCARLQGEAEQPLIWLNDVIDAQAQLPTEQEFSLRCLFLSLRGAPTDGPATRDWLLQLLARTQLAFAETEDESSKLYLCDVFMLSVTIFSGAWALEDCTQLIRRSVRQELLPASVAALLARPVWAECTLQVLEWLSWCASSDIEPATRASCQRALLALRHSPRFSQHKLWKRLDSNIGKTTSTLDD